MSVYKELLAKRAALDAEIEKARVAEIGDAKKTIRDLIAIHHLTAEDIFGASASGRTSAKGKRATVAPKYRDPNSGKTWTGRGKPPKWIEGKDRGVFLIA